MNAELRGNDNLASPSSQRKLGSSDFVPRRVKTLDPSFRWDDDMLRLRLWNVSLQCSLRQSLPEGEKLVTD